MQRGPRAKFQLEDDLYLEVMEENAAHLQQKPQVYLTQRNKLQGLQHIETRIKI